MCVGVLLFVTGCDKLALAPESIMPFARVYQLKYWAALAPIFTECASSEAKLLCKAEA